MVVFHVAAVKQPLSIPTTQLFQAQAMISRIKIKAFTSLCQHCDKVVYIEQGDDKVSTSW